MYGIVAVILHYHILPILLVWGQLCQNGWSCRHTVCNIKVAQSILVLEMYDLWWYSPTLLTNSWVQIQKVYLVARPQGSWVGSRFRGVKAFCTSNALPERCWDAKGVEVLGASLISPTDQESWAELQLKTDLSAFQTSQNASCWNVCYTLMSCQKTFVHGKTIAFNRLGVKTVCWRELPSLESEKLTCWLSSSLDLIWNF